ncbi:beta-galactosidase [Mitsuaria sp. BK045]|uniref:beta-galactosidase n=1 Tax=unclassified Roseateles TaxID=2626991 RepID=UPI0017D77A48|nr:MULTISPECIES: beta-galactosidase [unclassified Roseateles]MBB3295240.1 beta-galactosidase [Mitsuaria sp. BK041]MBB3364456.1 beta-galactosidase [Mitsuaria sp. BK045]
MPPISFPSDPPAPLRLGVCYYPEQWPKARWREDARAMRALGLGTVRIAEFAWSRMEPAPGQFDWAWLDEAIDVLAGEGLSVVLGTPTAAPPQWLVEAHPDVLPVGADGRVKPFGARRHYCFSSPSLTEATRRIVTAMARRYGGHPAVVAWQTDNEYGCHDTTLSYSPAALAAFRRWLRARYETVERMNEAWGTAFWGLQFLSFEQVSFPVGQPTSPLPAHALDFRRFASDEVVRYNRLQVELIRAHAPGRPVLHNFMGLFAEFDHHACGADLDIAAWDSYPLGHVDTAATFLTEAERQQWARTGHPDLTAFHHDLYRGIGRGRMWVMEQQAGPVNWADWNALPLPGMVRAWTWEAFAHGAELVSYFRWRQLPFGQEQMHSGLNRPDGALDDGGREAAQVGAEIGRLLAAGDAASLAMRPAAVALVMDYPSLWMAQIQPQGKDMAGFGPMLAYYGALRRLGLDVDIVAPDASLAGYPLVVLPGTLHLDEALVERLRASTAVVIAGPRTGSKTDRLAIAEPLPPGPLREWLPVRVRAVESMRPGRTLAIDAGAHGHGVGLQWRDLIELDAGDAAGAQEVRVLARYEDGAPAWLARGRFHLHAGHVDTELLLRWVDAAAREAGLSPLAPEALAPGLRLRRRGQWLFAIHRGPQPAVVPVPQGAIPLLGGATLPPGGVGIWHLSD